MIACCWVTLPLSCFAIRYGKLCIYLNCKSLCLLHLTFVIFSADPAVFVMFITLNSLWFFPGICGLRCASKVPLRTKGAVLRLRAQACFRSLLHQFSSAFSSAGIAVLPSQLGRSKTPKLSWATHANGSANEHGSGPRCWHNAPGCVV